MTEPVVLSLLDQPDDDPQRSVELSLPAPADWPAPPSPAAYHGLVGEIVGTIAPHTEADPVAILSQLLVAFGAAAGRGAWFQVEATRHHPNEFLVLIGDSARARICRARHIAALCCAPNYVALRWSSPRERPCGLMTAVAG